MLRRLLTAAVLILFTVGALYRLPTSWLAVPFGAVVLVAAWEWGRLAGLEARGAAVYAAVLLPLLALPVVAPAAAAPIALASLPWWMMAWIRVASHPGAEHSRWPRPAWLAVGPFVLVPAFAAVLAVHAGPEGPWRLLYLLVLVWAADTGAYFVGRRWGRRRLAPRVSPGKTWEGVWGGVGAAVLVAAAGPALGLGRGPGWFALALVVVLSSIVGDLLESVIKREHGVKDSSHLLPGHGGVLDRIDSLTAAAPVYLAGVLLTGGGS